MDELDKGLSISAQGPIADEALANFKKQAADWQIALPDVQPLVLDFGLGRFSEIGLIEFWLANEANAGYCGKYLFVFDGQSCPRHHHLTKHETFFVMKGRLEVNYGMKSLILNEGDCLPIAPKITHGFRGLGPTLLLELSMPCQVDDNFFEDTRIPIGGNYQKQQ
ncbi:MAG: D-lyxose/D-mannose family sugar isomerase [Opitutaceae bacterium]|nr:D-lyxose/D-mannose family sugar isomerase [Opitutaceae bacterium]